MGSMTSKSSSNDQRQGCYHQVIVYQIPCLCVIVHTRAPCVSAKISARVSRSANLSCRLMEAGRADGELPSALSAAGVLAAAHLSRPADKVICLWLSCRSLSQNGRAAINKKRKRGNRSGSRYSASCARADKNHDCLPSLETFRRGQRCHTKSHFLSLHL